MDNKNDHGNDAVTSEVTAILAENVTLKTENAQLKEQLDAAHKQLRAANDLIDNHTRASLIAQVQARSDYGIEALSKMTADQLRQVIQHYDHVKSPALIGSDLPGPTKPEVLGDVYGAWRKP